MRLCHYFTLAACCLLALGLRTSADKARAQASPAAGPAAPRGPYPTFDEVEFYGENPKDASDGALKEAAKRAASYFQQNIPAIGNWTPPEDSLLKKRVISPVDVPEQIEFQDRVSYKGR